MRILAIRGQNLASLARTFEVDFAAGPLAGAGLFAITGPVGAGKSTLLDALCLALFDRTPRLSGHGGAPVGDDGTDEKDWLRSTDPRLVLRRDATAGHAEADFTGRDGVRYRARWSVRRARSGSRRLQHQEMLLTDLDRGVVAAGGSRTEVLAAIRQRLGLDFAQFCRSVLLAQGEFSAFLRAKADERSKLLEALTGADVYRRLSRAAHERARAADVELGKLNAQLDAQAPLSDAARAEIEQQSTRLAGQVEVGRIAVDIAGRYVSWHEQAERHRRRESEATVALETAKAADAAASARRELLQRRQRAVAAGGRFEVAREAQADVARAADAARDAGVHVQREQRALDAAAATFANAVARELGGDGTANVADVPLLRELAASEPLLLQWQQADARASTLAAAAPQRDAAVAAASARADAAKAAAARAREVHDVAKRTLAAAQQTADDPELQQFDVRRRQIAAARAATAAAELAASSALRDGAATRVQELRRRADALRTRNGLEPLRAQLVAGEPCPLCGSAEHPAAGHRDDGELSAAQQLLAQAEAAQEHAERRAAVALAADEHARRELERHASPGDTPTTAAFAPADLAAAEQALAALADRAAAAGRALQRALRDTAAKADAAHAAERALQLAERGRDTAVDARASLQHEAVALAARIVELRDALAPACAGLPGGAAAMVRLGDRRLPVLRALAAARAERTSAEQRAAAAATAATTAQQDVERASAAAKRAAEQLAKALDLANVGVDDVADALAAGPQGLAAEAEALQVLADAVKHGRTVVQERARERQQHEGRDRPTLDAADAARALREARASEAAAAKTLADVRVQLAADDLVRKQRAELAPRLAAATAHAATWSVLDELIGSSSGDAFAVFAQGLTLDLLLIEANRRLAELARRYRLQRNPGGELDFFVLDLDLGGSARSLQTLSGGETFLVSLALALALATLAAPKARVETLFLDEGFGTLDAQSLEIALGALDSLQASGCQVGIISHVDGIAERIGAQVVVQPEGAGQSRVFAQQR